MSKYKKIKKTTLGIVISLVSVFLLMIIIICINWFGVLHKYYVQPRALECTASYEEATTPLDADLLAYLSTNENYALGSNSKGQVVFQHARKAYSDNKKENKDGRKALRDVYDLGHFSKTYYKVYVEKSKEIKVGDINQKTGEPVTAEDVEQAQHFGQILEIYSHSYKGYR